MTPRQPDRVTWDEGFASRYDEWAAHMTEDVAFYAGLARQADGPLVELAVGNGRVAIPVAQATGRTVIGIDSSPRHAGPGPGRGRHHRGAARPARRRYARPGPGRAGGAHLLPGPGGRFAWAAFAFDHQVAVRYDGVPQAEPVPHTVRYAVGENRVDIVRDDGARSSLWWATKNEWLGLIDVAGLEVEALYGGFAGEPFTDDSREYVFVTRRVTPA
jgi:hypothetical protein